MAMSKKQLATLERIASTLERGLRFVKSDKVLVCVKSHGTTTLDYIRPSDGTAVYAIDKDIGSELVLIETALRDLNRFAGFVQPTTI